MTSLRVFLIGEESTAARTLEAVLSRDLDVVGVASEGRAALGKSALDIAGDHDLATFAPKAVASRAFADRLRAEGVDLLLNVHSLVILPGEVVTAPTIGSYNLHPGPLPRYGGLNAPSWGIYEGARTFAVTLHWMDEGVDTGPVAFEAAVPITDDDTGLSLSARCASEGLALIDSLLDCALGDPATIPRTAQPPGERRVFGPSPPFPETMPWTLEASQIERLVRASNFLPFASPWGLPTAVVGDTTLGLCNVALTGVRAGVPAGTATMLTAGAARGGGCERVDRDSTSRRRREGRRRPRRLPVEGDRCGKQPVRSPDSAKPRDRHMIYRGFEQADRPAVIALLERVFAGWGGEDSVAYWEWKFDRNPHGQARIWLAEEDGVIAGCYIYNPVRATTGGSTIDAAQSVDAAVDVAFQGRGIFTSLAQLARDEAGAAGLQLVYAFPSEGAYNGQLRIGFVPHDPIVKLYRPLPFAPRASSKANGFVFPDARHVRRALLDVRRTPGGGAHACRAGSGIPRVALSRPPPTARTRSSSVRGMASSAATPC